MGEFKDYVETKRTIPKQSSTVMKLPSFVRKFKQKIHYTKENGIGMIYKPIKRRLFCSVVMLVVIVT